jgi:hypothetical protein
MRLGNALLLQRDLKVILANPSGPLFYDFLIRAMLPRQFNLEKLFPSILESFSCLGRIWIR